VRRSAQLRLGARAGLLPNQTLQPVYFGRRERLQRVQNPLIVLQPTQTITRAVSRSHAVPRIRAGDRSIEVRATMNSGRVRK
jgi:hypothetical protein